MKISISLIFLIVLFFLHPQNSFAEKVLSKLLPDQMKSKGFKTPYNYRVYDDQSLYGYIDGGAPFYLERGFSKLINQEYVAGGDSVIVDIYMMKDGKSAYDLFNAVRRKDSKVLKLGKEGQEGGTQIEFYQDKYFVRITAFKNEQVILDTLHRFGEETSSNISKYLKESEKK